jgi:hypothetical protein
MFAVGAYRDLARFKRATLLAWFEFMKRTSKRWRAAVHLRVSK